jgi:crossover junction endodeoxyribonuclease RusA
MRITVYGKPITQGSKIRTRWSMRDANGATLAPWRDNVRSVALNTIAIDGISYGKDPVTVDIRFSFARPASHFGTGKNAGQVKASAPPFPSSHSVGDIDKCARAILDALTDAGVFADDSQVVELDARKVWVGDLVALDRPGAVIDVQAARTTAFVEAVS